MLNSRIGFVNPQLYAIYKTSSYKTTMHDIIHGNNGGYRDNLINGLVHYLIGPHWLRIAMECFVVIAWQIWSIVFKALGLYDVYSSSLTGLPLKLSRVVPVNE